jgi:hypothetical protein
MSLSMFDIPFWPFMWDVHWALVQKSFLRCSAVKSVAFGQLDQLMTGVWRVVDGIDDNAQPEDKHGSADGFEFEIEAASMLYASLVTDN